MSDLMKHRRKVWPGPSGPVWKIACDCGWGAAIEVGRAKRGSASIQAKLNRLFVDHLPDDARQLYVLVDQRIVEAADPEDQDDRDIVGGNWLMPEGAPCRFEEWFESGGLRYVKLIEPVTGTFPVGEVRTRDGQVFRLE